MKPGVLAAILVVIVVAIGAFVFVNSDDSTDDESSSTTTPTQSQTQNQQSTTNDQDATTVPAQDDSDDTTAHSDSSMTSYTVSEVAEHDSESDCWTIINGSVYDITSYIPQHRGGDVILEACGIDGSLLFSERQSESGETFGSGTSHSNNAANQLAELKIGTLTQ